MHDMGIMYTYDYVSKVGSTVFKRMKIKNLFTACTYEILVLCCNSKSYFDVSEKRGLSYCLVIICNTNNTSNPMTNVKPH